MISLWRTPSSFAASTEVLNLMLKHLPALRPDLYLRNRDTIKLKSHSQFKEEVWSTDLKNNGIHPLDLAARLVQEDLIIMLPLTLRKIKLRQGGG